MKHFTFHNPGKLVFGAGAAKKRAAAELKALGVHKAILVTDQGLASSEIIKTVKESLGDRLTIVFSDVVPDTGFDLIDLAAGIAREAGVGGVVSVGGGSSIDTAKAVAAVLGGNARGVRELVGFNKLVKGPLPHLAIPTTAGTGSECTSMAVIKDREAHKKVLLLDSKLTPNTALLDPTLTTGLSPSLTAATGMDAMTHAAESIMSVNASPLSDALAVHAVSVIRENLSLAVENGDDIAARSMMLIAAAEAGQAFQNALVGVVHAMAHAMGGLFGVPHGLANAILLWGGMDYNSQTVPDRVALIGKAMGIEPAGDVREDAEAAARAMHEFTLSLGLPSGLAAIGMDEEKIAACAQLALADPALFSNPRRPEGPGELVEIYRKCL